MRRELLAQRLRDEPLLCELDACFLGLRTPSLDFFEEPRPLAFVCSRRAVLDGTSSHVAFGWRPRF